MLQHIWRKMLEVSEESALATDIDGIHNIPTHNEDHALKPTTVVPAPLSRLVYSCRSHLGTRLTVSQWWIISDSNRSDVLSARQVATPSSPITQIKCDFQATSKITTPLRPVELSAVLCPWRFPVSTRSLIYYTQ